MHPHHSNPPLTTGFHVGAWLLALHLIVALAAFLLLQGGAGSALTVLVGPVAYAFQVIGLELGHLRPQVPLAVVIVLALTVEWLLAFGVGMVIGKIARPR